MTIENLIIYAPRQGALSAKHLQEELDCRRVGHAENRDVRKIPDGALIVNYGFGYWPDWLPKNAKVRWLNHPTAVYQKISKVWQLDQFSDAGVPTLELTKERRTANRWLKAGHRVMARSDAGMDGDGIQVVEPGQELPNSEFYTQYFDKTHEYRYHVFQGAVIDRVQKKRDTEHKMFEKPGQGDVRTWSNGWIFAHRSLHLPKAADEIMERACINAVAAVGLDFGAVDILAKFDGDRLEACAVCEVNSAPGLVKDQTIEAYVKAIKAVYEG